MNIDTLALAIEEAERFVTRARAAVEAIGSDKYYYSRKETSAARRASMDLTRALADMRKPG